MHAQAAQDAPLCVVNSALTVHSISASESGRAVAASSGEESRAMSRALSDSISCPIPQNLIHALKKAPDVDTSKHFFLQRL